MVGIVSSVLFLIKFILYIKKSYKIIYKCNFGNLVWILRWRLKWVLTQKYRLYMVYVGSNKRVFIARNYSLTLYWHTYFSKPKKKKKGNAPCHMLLCSGFFPRRIAFSPMLPIML